MPQFHSVPTSFNFDGRFLKLQMTREARKRGVKIYNRVMMTDLLASDGEIAGAAGVGVRDGNIYSFKAKAVVLGSCTVNNTVLRPTAGLLEEIKGHKFKGKLGAAFGSYGWSGEAPKNISAALETAGLKIVQEPLAIRYRPSEKEFAKCRAFGENIAIAILGK